MHCICCSRWLNHCMSLLILCLTSHKSVMSVSAGKKFPAAQIHIFPYTHTRIRINTPSFPPLICLSLLLSPMPSAKGITDEWFQCVSKHSHPYVIPHTGIKTYINPWGPTKQFLPGKSLIPWLLSPWEHYLLTVHQISSVCLLHQITAVCNVTNGKCFWTLKIHIQLGSKPITAEVSGRIMTQVTHRQWICSDCDNWFVV